ncbi:MAG: LysR family transcriptional regulator [Candidatus Protistobacter heckmanni]|nr:LysR family transcriptional regulator [Candidatus Protistobacter heckmanni]
MPPTGKPARRGLDVKFRLRISRDEEIAVGPGKVALLEAIAEAGSISAGGRQLGMSYRRAWLLVDAMNRSFKSPVVETATGGAHGGGAAVTETGMAVIRLYREIEASAEKATRGLVGELESMVVAPGKG